MKTRRIPPHRRSPAPVDKVSAAMPGRAAPTYEPDDGPLSDAQLEWIRQQVPQGRFKAKREKSLFDLGES